MALSGLDIFKLLPKSNCKKCNMPTCLAFAMQLAQKKAKLEDCPHVSQEARQALAAAAAPPMRQVKFGSGDAEVQMGKETVLFRHEEKFYSPTVIAIRISDKLTGDELDSRIKAVKALQFERVGEKMGVNTVAIVNDSGSADAFVNAAAAAQEAGFALILVSDSVNAMAAAAGKTAATVPLIASATKDNVNEMTKIAKDNKCPIVAQAESIEAVADLSEKIKAGGVEDIVLSFAGMELRDKLYNLSRTRALSLKKLFRPLGYPTISFVTDGDADEQAVVASSLICKYSGIVVVDITEPYAILPMLTVRMNIYSDPQKPVQVEPKLYKIGEPDENSPVFFTTNFSLTYYTVESDVEAARIPAYIMVVDTEGTSVLTAYSGDKLNENLVAQAIKKCDLENVVKHRKIVIPGYVAVMSGKLEEATGWEVLVGPRESSMIPKYLQEVWK